MGLPQLTLEERREALRKAMEMRRRRARLRNDLKSGALTLQQVLARADDEVIARMRVFYLLTSLPQIGKVTAQRIMDELGIAPNRRVQGLGKRQIEALLKRMEG